MGHFTSGNGNSDTNFFQVLKDLPVCHFSRLQNKCMCRARCWQERRWWQAVCSALLSNLEIRSSFRLFVCDCCIVCVRRAARIYSSRQESEGQIQAWSRSRWVLELEPLQEKPQKSSVGESGRTGQLPVATLCWQPSKPLEHVKPQSRGPKTERTGECLDGTEVGTYQARGSHSGLVEAKPVKPVAF